MVLGWSLRQSKRVGGVIGSLNLNLRVGSVEGSNVKATNPRPDQQHCAFTPARPYTLLVLAGKDDGSIVDEVEWREAAQKTPDAHRDHADPIVWSADAIDQEHHRAPSTPMPSLPRLKPRQDVSSTTSTSAPTADAPPGTSSASMAFVSRSKRVRFDLTLRILDLNNVPLVSGTSFIKWHLPSSTAAEHRGSTAKCAIRDHRVAYDYEKKMAVRLTVGKDGMLQESTINFEVLQEYGPGGRGERIRLGDVKLNLAEYVEASELQSPASPGGGSGSQAGDVGVVRRYLMQDSKINSTLKVGITMRHVEGTREYWAPALKTAPVFGGIAGIIHSGDATNSTVRGAGTGAEPASGEGVAEGSDPVVPNFTSRNKEAGEMRDMYRRTLAAFWSSGPHEMRADESVEDIFSGGDGWGKNGRPSTRDEAKDGLQDSNRFEGSRPGSGTTTPNAQDGDGLKMTPVSPGRGIMGSHHRHHRKSSKVKGYKKGQGEVDEFDVRQDLVSWRIGENATI